jgi:hypothetical protein
MGEDFFTDRTFRTGPFRPFVRGETQIKKNQTDATSLVRLGSMNDRRKKEKYEKHNRDSTQPCDDAHAHAGRVKPAHSNAPGGQRGDQQPNLKPQGGGPTDTCGAQPKQYHGVMAAAKVKKITDEQALHLATIDDTSAIADSQRRLAPIVGDLADADWLTRGVAQGLYSVRDVELGGHPIYRFFFQVNDHNQLYIAAALALGAPDFTSCVFWGAERLAHDLGCVGITFNTQRRGLIKLGLDFGYKTAGIVLVKKL